MFLKDQFYSTVARGMGEQIYKIAGSSPIAK